jgi:hypothetical protein
LTAPMAKPEMNRSRNRLNTKAMGTATRMEHGGDQEGPQHLPEGGVGRPRVADVAAPLGGVLEEGQLVGRLGPERVPGQPAVELGHALGEGREVVQLDAQVAAAKFSVY